MKANIPELLGSGFAAIVEVRSVTDEEIPTKEKRDDKGNLLRPAGKLKMRKIGAEMSKGEVIILTQWADRETGNLPPATFKRGDRVCVQISSLARPEKGIAQATASAFFEV